MYKGAKTKVSNPNGRQLGQGRWAKSAELLGEAMEARRSELPGEWSRLRIGALGPLHPTRTSHCLRLNSGHRPGAKRTLAAAPGPRPALWEESTPPPAPAPASRPTPAAPPPAPASPSAPTRARVSASSPIRAPPR